MEHIQAGAEQPRVPQKIGGIAMRGSERAKSSKDEAEKPRIAVPQDVLSGPLCTINQAWHDAAVTVGEAYMIRYTADQECHRLLKIH